MAFPLAIAGQIPGLKLEDLRAPRIRAETLTGWKARSNWAHINTLETFPFFAAGVIIASITGAQSGMLDLLAVSFIGSRLVYTFLYLAGFGVLRSTVWMIGIGLIIAIYLQAV
jgi:uncharacterized MAPEG superfamily protein